MMNYLKKLIGLKMYLIKVGAIMTLMFCGCVSCASSKPMQLRLENQTWRICSKKIDGEKYHLKGFCYWDKKFYKKWFKWKSKRVHKFCSFEDAGCVEEQLNSGKVLTKRLPLL